MAKDNASGRTRERPHTQATGKEPHPAEEPLRTGNGAEIPVFFLILLAEWNARRNTD